MSKKSAKSSQVQENLPFLSLESTEMKVVKPSEIEDRLSEAQQIASDVAFTDSNQVLTFGEKAQRNLSNFLDTLLQGIKIGDTGVAGELTVYEIQNCETS